VITLRKLAGLAPTTRARKLMSLLAAGPHDPTYDAGLVALAQELTGHTRPVVEPHDRADLRYALAAWLGVSVADWDFQAPPDRSGEATRFPFHAWLDDVRSPFNVGSLVRTAEAFGFSSLGLSPGTPGLDQPRTRRSAMGAEAYLPIQVQTLEDLRSSWGPRPVFALELGGTPLAEFAFPHEGLVLVGGEELGLRPEALAWADASAGRVSLPLYGRKASLNVGVAFGILAAAWTSRA